MHPSKALALFVVLSCSGVVGAQEIHGELVGRVSSEAGAVVAGQRVTLRGSETGMERSTTTDARGEFRFPSLPSGTYELAASVTGAGAGAARVEVVVGRTASVQLVLQPGGGDPRRSGGPHAIDVECAESEVPLPVQVLSERLPVEREMTPVAMLAPAPIAGDADFNPGGWDGSWSWTPGQRLASIGGGSVAENAYLLNGLEITNFRNGLGSNLVPFEFVDQLQLSTGGARAEYAGSTGGTLNMATRAGSNTLHGGASVYWRPEDLQENEPNAGSSRNRSESRQAFELNASLGGALARDRLFFFGFVSYMDSEELELAGERGITRSIQNPYWGARIDWRATDRHALRLSYLDDSVSVDRRDGSFEPEQGEPGEVRATAEERRGGPSWVLSYTGLLGDQLVLSARYGRNEFDRTTSWDGEEYPYALDCREACTPVGLWTTWQRSTATDEREAYRLDLDWYLASHGLAAGIDIQDKRSLDHSEYSGGVRYTYSLNHGQYPELPADSEIVEARVQKQGGSSSVESRAIYLQDSWRVAPRLSLDIGLRWERFDSTNAAGETFLVVNDRLLPRIGVAWDPLGNGRSKLFGSFGSYQLPMPSAGIALSGGRVSDEFRFYELEGGILPDGSPESLGMLLESIVISEGFVTDPRVIVASTVDPIRQRELIVGYERAVGSRWTLGVRGIARKLEQGLEDFTIDEGLANAYGVEGTELTFRFGNPGRDFEGWYDLDGDGEPDRISIPAEAMGYPEASRSTYALELTAARRFTDRWLMRASYTWSHNYGNYEGLADSDIGCCSVATHPRYDYPGLMEHSSGNLPNDRRHVLKGHGTYAWPFGLQLGGFGWFRSGRPINGFGVHPDDPLARAYGAVSFYNGGEPCPRGCAGTTDSVWGLDLMLRYGFRAAGVDWDLRLDAFNVFDSDTVTEVDEQAETNSGEANPSYLEPVHHQPPRSVRLGFGLSF